MRLRDCELLLLVKASINFLGFAFEESIEYRVGIMLGCRALGQPVNILVPNRQVQRRVMLRLTYPVKNSSGNIKDLSDTYNLEGEKQNTDNQIYKIELCT